MGTKEKAPGKSPRQAPPRPLQEPHNPNSGNDRDDLI